MDMPLINALQESSALTIDTTATVNINPRKSPCSIYIAHAGDTPELVGFLRGFLSQQVVACIDESAQIRYFRPTTESQLGIFQQLADVDLVLLVISDGLSRSPWVVEEIRIARALGKRIIALRPRSDGSLPLCEHGLMDCRVLDIAEDADRTDAVDAIFRDREGLSLFLSGVDLVNLRTVQRRLAERGAFLDFDDRALTEALLWDLAGNGGSVLWNTILERSDVLARRLARRAGLVDATILTKRPIHTQLRRYGPIFLLTTVPEVVLRSAA